MNDNDLRQLLAYVNVNRPSWKFIIEGEVVRVCTEQFVIDFEIFRQIEDMKKFEIFEIITHSLLGQIVCFRAIEQN